MTDTSATETGEVAALARDTIMRRGDMSITLTLAEGQTTFDLRMVAGAMKALDRLLRAVAKEVSPAERLEPVIVRVDILEPSLRLYVTMRPVPKGAKRGLRRANR